MKKKLLRECRALEITKDTNAKEIEIKAVKPKRIRIYKKVDK